ARPGPLAADAALPLRPQLRQRPRHAVAHLGRVRRPDELHRQLHALPRPDGRAVAGAVRSPVHAAAPPRPAHHLEVPPMNTLVTQMTSARLDQLRGRTDVLDLTDYVHDASTRTFGAVDHLIDVDQVRHAQQFFATSGLPITAGLLFKALPESYAA